MAAACSATRGCGSRPPSALNSGTGTESLWYKRRFLVALFGGVGGLAAWMFGEVAWALEP